MKIKDFIYKYSIRLFILIVAYLIVSFPFQYTQEKMNDVSQPVRWLGTLLFFIIACFIVRYRKKLEAVFAKKSLFFIIFVMIFAFNWWQSMYLRYSQWMICYICMMKQSEWFKILWFRYSVLVGILHIIRIIMDIY